MQTDNHAQTGEPLVIPDKRYFTISEVSTLCDVKPHVLRYWEQEFSVLRPSKRRGNRRYYRREDVMLVAQIKGLLYDQGYTISGARLQLSTLRQSKPAAVSMASPIAQATPVQTSLPLSVPTSIATLKPLAGIHTELIRDLQAVLKILS